MKHLLRLAFILVITFGYAQDIPKIDSVAIDLIDKTSRVISELSSVTFKLETSTDFKNDINEYERHFETHDIHLVGPDKMAVQSRGDKGSRAVWYDGEFLTYYSFDENNYVTLDAPDNIITMADSMYTKYDFKFPAMDLFYPTLTDDILENFNTIKYLGLKVVDGQECFHVMASSKTMTFQLWITNNAMFLPKRFLFVNKEKQYKQHEGTFNHWKLNPDLPKSIFEFTPPQNAKLISILVKS